MNARSMIVMSLEALAIFNLIVTLFVAASSAFARGQKARICALIWPLPLLGAIGVGLFLSVQGNVRPLRRNRIGAVDLDHNAIGLSNATHRNI